jgi:periplasmic protein TonB
MTMVPFHARLRPGRAWAQWGVSLLVVLAVHGLVLLRLHRTIPAIGPAVPEAIMMDLAPEPAAPPVPAEPDPVPPPDPPPELPPPPEPPPPELPPPPEPVAIPDPTPPVAEAEVPLPPPPPPRPQKPPPPRPTRVQPTPHTDASPPTAAPVEAPPGPAAAPPPGQVVQTWQGQLLAHLARFKRFPPEAQRRGEQGTVLMHVLMAKSGQVLSMSMARGSGYADLDAEAQAWITRAEPLPAFPPEITAGQMDLVIPLRFTIR